MSTSLDDDVPLELVARLRQWSGAGLISAEQVAAIRRWESIRGAGLPAGLSTGLPQAADRPADPRVAHEAPAAGSALSSPVVEALAYVGGAVIVAALSVVTVGYWQRLNEASQIGIPTVVVVLTLLAGALVPMRWGDISVRVRASLWLVSTFGLGALMSVIVAIVWEDYFRASLVLIAAPCFALAAALWLAHRASAQHAAAFVATNMLGSALLQLGGDSPGEWTGLAIAGVSLVWGALCVARLMPGCGRWAAAAGVWGDQDAMAARQRQWGVGLAAAGAVCGGIVLAFDAQTSWAGLIPVAIVVAAGVSRSSLMILIIGAIGTMIVLPAVIDRYFASTMTTALVLLTVGAAMVTLAIVVARRKMRRDTPVAEDALLQIVAEDLRP